MARKIAFINYKGGVGKTSCLVNVAACLAKRGSRVLIVDLDAQSNASIWLMRLELWNKINQTTKGSLYSIFEPGQDRLKDIIARDTVKDKSGKCALPGLDIIPTTFNLTDLEHEYVGNPQKPHYSIFYEQLTEIEADYDYIFFDCPPNVLYTSQCGLFCANEVYVPSNPDALSLVGLTLLVSKLGQFHQRALSFRVGGMMKPCMIQGVLFNSIKSDADIEVPKMRMQFRLNQFRNAKKVGPNAKIFGTNIRDAMIVRRAVTLGLPVILVGSMANDSGESVVTDYQNLASELERHRSGVYNSDGTLR